MGSIFYDSSAKTLPSIFQRCVSNLHSFFNTKTTNCHHLFTSANVPCVKPSVLDL